MSDSAKRLAQFAACFFLLFGTIVALNFSVDSLQLFRPATFYRPYYMSDPRTQNAGLIRSQTFDTVFIGSSLGMRYRKSDIDRVFGVTSVKLAMSGPSSAELNLIINTALSRHPRQVIWQMDDWMFRDGPDINTSQYFPANLYRMNLSGVSSYLFSLVTLRESVAVLLRQTRITGLIARTFSRFGIADVNEINTLSPDFDASTIFNSKKATHAFRLYRDPKNLGELAGGYNYEAMVKNFERDAIGLIEQKRDLKFTIYFPPYSILQFVALRDFAPNVLDIIYRFNIHALKRLSEMPNVTLFDFRDDNKISHDLDNYMDTVHHSPNIDVRVMEEIRAGLHLVDRNNPTQSIETLRQQVGNYVAPQ
jgi:hypothetical protein